MTQNRWIDCEETSIASKYGRNSELSRNIEFKNWYHTGIIYIVRRKPPRSAHQLQSIQKTERESRSKSEICTRTKHELETRAFFSRKRGLAAQQPKPLLHSNQQKIMYRLTGWLGEEIRWNQMISGGQMCVDQISCDDESFSYCSFLYLCRPLKFVLPAERDCSA